MQDQAPSRDRRRADRTRRSPRPVDKARLDELALAYVARFATSAARLEAYLRRKLRECGWEGEGSPDLAAIVARLVDLGYVDDHAYAQARTGSLLRRGFGARRVDQDLGAAGIAEDLRADVRPELAEQRRAALALARRRRLGPFGPPAADRAAREKQIATLLRAGHPLDMARFLVNAASTDMADAWAAGDDEE